MLKHRILLLTLAIVGVASLSLHAQSSSSLQATTSDWSVSGRSNRSIFHLAALDRSSSSQPIGSMDETDMANAADSGTIMPPPAGRSAFQIRPFRQYAGAFRFGSLGFGPEIATPLGRRTNLRMGANFFGYNGTFGNGGWNYDANLNFKSGQVQVDYFPFYKAGGFHVSPGLAFQKNHGSAFIHIDPGARFDMGDGTYTNSVTDPVKGNATFAYDRTVAPMLTFGFGNLIPRNGRRWSIPVDIGVVFTGAPKFGLDLDGTVCDTQGCGKLSTDATAMADMQRQRVKIQDDLNSYATVYPVISVGFAWNFGSRE